DRPVVVSDGSCGVSFGSERVCAVGKRLRELSRRVRAGLDVCRAAGDRPVRILVVARGGIAGLLGGVQGRGNEKNGDGQCKASVHNVSISATKSPVLAAVEITPSINDLGSSALYLRPAPGARDPSVPSCSLPE